MTRVLSSPPRMMQGATATVDGVSGYVPTPTAGNHTTEFLRKDGQWAEPAGGGGGAGVSYNASTNNSGNTTVTPTESLHTEQMTFGGSGSTTRIVILSTAGVLTAGSRLFLRVLLPSTAEIRIEFRNATSGGTLEHVVLTDGTGDDMSLEFYSNGSAWKFDKMVYPATAST